MDDAELHHLEPASVPAPEDDVVFVVTHAFGEYHVGDEVNAQEIKGAPPHAFVRRGKEAPPKPTAEEPADKPQA